MIHVICQWLLVVTVVASLLRMLYVDMHGSPAKPPAGFAGVVSTLIAVGIAVLLYWGAGAFSLLPAGN